MPREIGCHRCRADSTARPDKRHDLAEFQAGFGNNAFRREQFGYEVTSERLDDVIADPGLDQIAVKGDAVAIPERDDIGARFADIGERVD